MTRNLNIIPSDAGAPSLPESVPNARYGWVFVFLAGVVILEQDLFYLIPGAKRDGGFDVSDIGLVIIALSNLLLAAFMTQNYARTLQNSIGLFIILLLWIVLIHIGMASLNYDQTIFDGFVGARIFFHFGIFFLFLYFFQNMPADAMGRWIDCLTVLGVIAGILALVNHFAVVIFHHDWAFGHGISRFGVKRAFVPGINIMTLCTLWCTASWLSKRRPFFSMACILFFFGLHILAQERGRLIGLSLALFCLLVYKKRFGLLAGIGVAVLLVVAGSGDEEKVFVEVYSSVFEELENRSGTWKPRLTQARTAMALFAEHPVLGSGTSAIRIVLDRQVKPNREQQMEIIGRGAKADLGYIFWLRDFGLLGIVLLVYYYFRVFAMSSRLLLYDRHNSHEMFGMFCMAYFLYIVVSFLTHNHFSHPQLIYLNGLYTAVLVKMHQDWQREYPAGIPGPQMTAKEGSDAAA